MGRSTHSYLPNLSLLVFSVLITVNPSYSARILSHNHPTPGGADQAITFFIKDVLENSHPSPSGIPTRNGAPPAFPKPMGLFPPEGRVPLTQPTAAFTFQSGPATGWPPILTSLQVLESGMVTVINEELMGGVSLGPPLGGTVQGIYVTSSHDNSSHMVAMKAQFAESGSEDSLRFFGIHQPDHEESHIAVVGGTGRYHAANGFAVVKSADPDVGRKKEKKKKVLSVSVYLK